MRLRSPLLAGCALALLAFTATCKNTSLKVACQSDSDCGTNFRCAGSGQFGGDCVCANNLACPSTDAGPMFCNPQGLCQSQVGCFSNADCNVAGLYCDTQAGLCVTGPACGSDIDCPIGQVCNQQLCVAGCRSNGDCPLTDGGAVVPCVCANDTECQCPPVDAGVADPASYDRSLCTIGQCNANTCAGDTSVCPYNDSCVGGGDGGGLSTCQTDPRDTVLCQNCSYSPGTDDTGCSGIPGANFCLLDLANPTGATTYCGVDCSEGQGCPSGYECDDVIVLTSSICTSDLSCSPTGGTCDAAAPDGGSGCPVDTICDSVGTSASGRCGGFCVKAEGETGGFCTCVEDSDCPQAACDPTSLTCPISQIPCALGSSCPISCVDFGGGRGCYIGRNCAPTHGLSCPLPNQE